MEHPFVQVVLGRMAEILKPAGFKRSKRTFVAARDGMLLFVDLQSSVGSTKNHVRLAVNFGAYSYRLAEALHEARPAVSFWHCHWRERVADVPQGRELWWDIVSPEDADTAAASVAWHLRNRVVPLLDEVSSTEAFTELVRAGPLGGVSEPRRAEYLDALTETA